jgi:hypothetical protein
VRYSCLRPLKLYEVAEAVAVDPKAETIDPENRLREPATMLDICSSLVTLSGHVIHFALAHRSRDELRFVQCLCITHLTRKFIQFCDCRTRGHRLFGRISLIYCTSVIATDTSLVGAFAGSRFLEELFPLLPYASIYWSDHLLHGAIENLRASEFVLIRSSLSFQLFSDLLEEHGATQLGLSL